MAVTNRYGRNSGFAIGRRLDYDTPITNRGPGSSAGTTLIADNADVTSTGAITLTAFSGYGTIEITNSQAGAGVYTVAGNDESGTARTETLTFVAATTSMETTNNYVSAGLTVTVSTAFGAGTTADVDANTVDAAGMIQKFFPVSNLDMNEDANVVESNLLNTLGSDSADEIGQFWGHVNFNTSVSTVDHVHFARGMFNPASLTSNAVASQTTTGQAIAANDTTDITAPSGGLNHPSRITFTFGTAPANNTSLTIRGNIKIGVKANNTRYREETFNFDGTTTTFTTTNYFVAEGLQAVNDTANALTAGLSWNPHLYEVSMRIRATDPIFNSWDVQGIIGNVPVVGRQVVPNQMTLTASTSTIDLEMQCVASQVTQFRTIDGGDTRQLTFPNQYPQASRRRYSPWAGVLTIGTTISEYNNFTFTFNRNYEADEVVDGNRFRTNINATDVRQVTIQPTPRFVAGDDPMDVFNEWQEIFRDEGRRLDVEWRAYSYNRHGQRQQIIYDFPSCQLNESPQTVVNDAGPIDQPLGMKALTDATNTSEITLTIYMDEPYTE